MRSAACFAEPFASWAPIQISSSPAISCALSGEAAAIAVMTGSFSGACERTQSSPRGGGTSCAKTVDSKVMPSGASLFVATARTPTCVPEVPAPMRITSPAYAPAPRRSTDTSTEPHGKARRSARFALRCRAASRDTDSPEPNAAVS